VAIISNATTIADAGAFSASLGDMTLIKTLTASSSGTLSFVDGASSVVLDNTYPIYRFEFINIHPATDSSSADAELLFQVDTGTNTSYNQTITSTYFRGQHTEGGSGGELGYRASGDQAQGTAFQKLAEGQGADADQSLSGNLTIFSPSSSTFVKHFLSNVTYSHHGNYTMNAFVGGYVNTTTALTRVQFKMTNGNIDSGKIKLYGIKDS
jgi:hypothetical protein